MNWDYLQPVKIRFGKGRVSEVKDLAKEMGIKNGLLVADPFFFTNGLAERIVKESEGAIIASFGDLSPNPDVTEVDACAAIIREKEIGFVVALGGGSSMDCAKAAASIALTDDCNGVQREHNKKLNNGLPILHKVPPKRDYGRYFCIMAEKGGTSHGGLTEKLSPFFHA